MHNSRDNFRFLTEAPVHRVVLTMAVPTIISMLVTALYNLADTFFVSQINTQATAAVGIVFSIMNTLEDVAKENQLDAIQSVTVEVGEVSAVIPEYLTDCWGWARKKRELMQNCRLLVETLPAVTHCGGCGEDYPTVEYGRICPHCGSEKTWLLTGNEINIKEITVDE